MALSIDFQDSVSFPPGYPSYRTLTLVLVGLTPTEYTSLRWTYIDSFRMPLKRIQGRPQFDSSAGSAGNDSNRLDAGSTGGQWHAARGEARFGGSCV
jgi:hypothetical protein